MLHTFSNADNQQTTTKTSNIVEYDADVDGDADVDDDDDDGSTDDDGDDDGADDGCWMRIECATRKACGVRSALNTIIVRYVCAKYGLILALNFDVLIGLDI